MIDIIPKLNDPEVYTSISAENSPFVELIDGDCFDIKMKYSLSGLKNAVSKCYVREEVASMLKKAQSLLPSGVRLRIWDAWRPFDLQIELYEKYSRALILQFDLEHKSQEEKQNIIRKYISFPTDDRNLPPVHTTGGAVDVTLIDMNGNELLMGTEFDQFTKEVYTAYYEADCRLNCEPRENRRLLYNSMISAGFTNLPSEWWHYDFGNRFWAYYNQKPAKYTGAFKIEEVNIK